MTEYRQKIYSEGIWVGRDEKVSIALIMKLYEETPIGGYIFGDTVCIYDGFAYSLSNCSGYTNDRKVGRGSLLHGMTLDRLVHKVYNVHS